jgi:pimeloyl-ACP methyl ester carboxylesterase
MKIFIHGLLSSGQAYKANFLRRHFFPDLLSPDFPGTLEERMARLDDVLGDAGDLIIIGSSFGGLMAALFTCAQPQRVCKLILLAPALLWPDFADKPPSPISVPTIVYHGHQDDIVPLAPTKALAQQVFTNLHYHEVDDDHSLHATVQAIDWVNLVTIS